MTSPLLSFRNLSDADAAALLSRYSIGLTVDEARKVEEMVGRPISLTEAVIWGIQGSEHCSYKSSRRFLATLPKENSHVILGPVEDAGIVAITDGPAGKRWGLVIGHESHNHPSQIVPFEGAATGIGGCVRDVLCMGARVIGCMDALRLGDLSTAETRDIAKEVVRGIAGYGNPLGIPNLGGDTVFDAAYNGNCLVNAITVGIVREDQIIHSHVPEEAGTVGYDIILIGKATDRSGFGGASFASATMDEEKREQNTGAVQEPNPFLERHILASTYELFDRLIAARVLDKVSFKDLGAGGVVCASVEQVADRGLGAIVDLDTVHTALPDLPPEVIGCAETQERLCWMCHPNLTQMIVDHYNVRWDLPSVAEGARASVIGKVTSSPKYTLLYKGEKVCDALARDITSGLKYNRPTVERKRTLNEPKISCGADLISVGKSSEAIANVFKAILSHPSHGSKSSVFRHYDKSVMGNTVLEPGEADASVITPLIDLQSYVHAGTRDDWTLSGDETQIGVALSVGGNGRYGRISPYLQGVNAVVETMRNVSAVGATPRAITDCLNYGNPEVPEDLKDLEEGVRGIADAARALGFNNEPTAVISGNVSLYNTTPEHGPIDPTAIVGCVAVMPDARKAVSQQLKKVGSTVMLLGTIKDECGGSAYYDVLEKLLGTKRDALLGTNVPSPDLPMTLKELTCMQELVRSELVLAAHDVSEGGLALALFEMTLPQRRRGGEIGLSIDLTNIFPSLRNDTILFSESGCFLLEVPANLVAKVEACAQQHGVSVATIGTTIEKPSLEILRGGMALINAPLKDLRTTWERALTQAWN